MSENIEIIRKLTYDQKIRLLSDFRVLAEKEYTDVGCPPVVIRREADIGGAERLLTEDVLPAWDRQLIKRAADAVAEDLIRAGANLALIPAPVVGISPLSPRSTEEPMLADMLSDAYREAMNKASLPFVVENAGLDKADADWMGDVPDIHTVSDILTAPLNRNFAEERFFIGRAVSVGDEREAVRSIGTDDVGDMPGCVFCTDIRPGESVRLINKGCVLIGGNVSELSAACTRYNREKQKVEAGLVSSDRLNKQVSDIEALSEETVEAALDRILDIARRVNSLSSDREKKLDVKSDMEADTCITSSSFVLLRNKGILPFAPIEPKNSWIRLKNVPTPKITTVVIGDLSLPDDGEKEIEALTEKLAAAGSDHVEFQKGYNAADCDGSEELINEACLAAEKADRVILMLRTDDGIGGECPAEAAGLPANRLALAYALRTYAAKTAIVVFSRRTFDPGFSADFSALLKAPAFGAAALIKAGDILCGTDAPKGHLTVSMFDDIKRVVDERKTAVSRYNLKTGPFTGYRAYTDTGIPVENPEQVRSSACYTQGFSFGHGLTYMTFKYTNMAIEDGNVMFTVTNNGKCTGTAVPQLYVGMKKSNLIRPDRQLCGFTSVELKPEETRVLTIPLRLPEAFDPKVGHNVTEQGTYTVMIGESASDIRLKKDIAGEGVVPERYSEQRFMYCASESNIVQEGYTLEANYTMKKRNPKNLILGLILLALAAAVRFFMADLGINSIAVSIISLMLLVSAVVVFVFEIIDRNKEETQLVSEITELNGRFFADAETVTSPNAAEVFVKAFETEKKQISVEKKENLQDKEYKFINRAYTLSDTLQDFIRYAASQGYQISEDAARTVFSAMSSSHLLIPCGMEQGAAADLQTLLCGFFGTEPSVSSAAASDDNASGLLITDGDSGKAYSALHRIIEEAANKPQCIFLHRLSGFDPAAAPNALQPFTRFAAAPKTANSIRFTGIDGNPCTLVIPENLWIMPDQENAMPGMACRVSSLIAETAAFFNVPVRKCEPAPSGKLEQFSFWQFRYQWENALGSFDIDEMLWKRIDRLTEYAAEHGGFRLSNRTDTGIEQSAAVSLAAGAEPETCMDLAVALRLIPSILNAVNGKLSPEDMTPEAAVEDAFGEDAFPLSVKAVRLCGRSEGAKSGEHA